MLAKKLNLMVADSANLGTEKKGGKKTTLDYIMCSKEMTPSSTVKH